MSDRGRGRSSTGGRGNGRGRSNTSNPERGIVPFPAAPVAPVNQVKQYTSLGPIPVPKPYSSALASQPKPFDPLEGPRPIESIPISTDPEARDIIGPNNPGGKRFDLCPEKPNPIQTIYPLQKSTSEYVPKPNPVTLFYVEPNLKFKRDPVKLAAQYFPDGWFFKPNHPDKCLPFYKDILVHSESITVKCIYDRNDQSKIIFHSIYILQVMSLEDWGAHPSALLSLPNHDVQYNYYDYMDAWFRIFMYQNLTHSHSWFVNWDQKFNSFFPYWFLDWWQQFGPEQCIFPEPLQIQMNHFSKQQSHWHKLNLHVPTALQFISKYKVPWIVKWQYKLVTPKVEEVFFCLESSSSTSVIHHSQIDIVVRQVFSKWWDKFNIDRIIGQVTKEFPLVSNLPTTIPGPDPLQVTNPNKASISGTKPVEPTVSMASSKSKKPKSSPPKKGSKYSKSQMMDAILALTEQVKEMKDEDSSSNSSQGSISNDPYDLYQDGQDPNY